MYKCNAKSDRLVQYKACTWIHSFIYPALFWILTHLNDEIKPINKVAQLEQKASDKPHRVEVLPFIQNFRQHTHTFKRRFNLVVYSPKHLLFQ